MSVADRARPGPSVAPKHRDDALKSVANTLDVLDCFMTDDELGVSEIARSLGVAKSSAHRMLSTLAGRGFVEQNPDSGRYRLGLHLYELGQLSVSRSRLRQAALPIMEDLRHAPVTPSTWASPTAATWCTWSACSPARAWTSSTHSPSEVPDALLGDGQGVCGVRSGGRRGTAAGLLPAHHAELGSQCRGVGCHFGQDPQSGCRHQPRRGGQRRDVGGGADLRRHRPRQGGTVDRGTH